LRGHYGEIVGAGAEVVAVGTGDERYAQAFVADEQVPFPVLVDDDAAAATAAAVKKVNFATLLFDPRSLKGARQAHRDGFRVKKSARRSTTPTSTATRLITLPSPTFWAPCQVEPRPGARHDQLGRAVGVGVR
jgi:hypothetical protein